MSFKAILGLKAPLVQPSDLSMCMNVAGTFEADEDNVWAVTPFGTWLTKRDNVEWLLGVAEDYVFDQEALPGALVLN